MPNTRNFGVLTVIAQPTPGTAVTTVTVGTNPDGYSFPLIDGGINPNKEWGDLPRRGDTLTRRGRFAQRATVGGTVSVLCTPEGLGMLLYHAMGAQAYTVGTPSKFTFTMADTWPNQLTVFQSIGSGTEADVWRFRDAQIARLRLNGTSGENIVVEMDLVAKHYTKPAAGIAAMPTGYSNAAVLQASAPRFKYIGSAVLLDTDGATPVQYTQIESVFWEVARDPATRYGTSLTPQTLAPDRMVNFGTNVTYDSAESGWEFLEDAYLAALAGNPDQSTPTGAFDVTFGKHPSSYSGSLRLVSGGGAALPTTVNVRQNWQYEVTRPTAAAAPDLIGFDVNGIVVDPDQATAESETTAILQNTRTAVYA